MKGLGATAEVKRVAVFDTTEDAVAVSGSDKDAEFVVQYLKHRNDPQAAKIACSKAGLRPDRDKTIDSLASWMMSRPDIQSAIRAAEASVAAVAPEAEVTLGLLTAHTEEIRQSAMDDRQYPAALNAVKLAAQMHGFLDTTINVNHSMKVEEMDTAALQRIAARGLPAVVDGEFKDVSPSE
jgi:hypothetical protein